MLLSLPVETLLNILSYVPISDIHSTQQSCKHLDMVVRSNKPFVYKMAAHLHGYASESSSMEVLRQKRRKKLDWIKSGDSWLDYCKARYMIESHWKIDLKISERAYGILNPSVEKLLLDEEDGVMLLTRKGPHNGYYVYCLSTKKLGMMYNDEDELVGFSNGYLLFKSPSSNLFKIWKRFTDPLQGDPSINYKERLTFFGKIDLQGYRLFQTSFKASRLIAMTWSEPLLSLIVYNIRENFRHGLLHPCIIIDIPLDDTIRSFDSNADHFFLLTNTGIHIYDLSSGEKVFRIWESTWHKIAIGRKAKGLTHQMFNLKSVGVHRFDHVSPPMIHQALYFVHPARGPFPGRNSRGIHWGNGTIRVSENGIVVHLTDSQTLIIIPEYKPIIQGESTIDNGTWTFDVACSGVAIDGNRIVCNGHSNQLYIFNLPFDEYPVIVEIVERYSGQRNPKRQMTLTESSLWFIYGDDWGQGIEWKFSQLEKAE